MKIDGGLGAANPASLTDGLAGIGEAARRLEDEGYAGGWTAETSHDPFLPHMVAAEHTQRLELGTSIAVAFARNPMVLAQIGHDLQRYSDGRFIMGLGTQIRPHITKRFSMEWSRPAARMREFVSAMRAIWDCWNDGTKLAFRGDFYTHTLMTPFFNPGPNACGPPRVFISAVGPLMSEVAGEVCDGIICHAFSTERYLREVTIPNIESGLAKAGRAMDDFEIMGPGFVVTGSTEEAMARAATGIRQQIAFYASTPAYKGVLELHGWEGLHDDLNAMSKRGEWKEMGDLIDDEMLDTFAVVAEPDRVADGIKARYGDCVDRMTFYALGGDHDADVWTSIVADLAA
ncbi:MAG: LLM class F420-dependent oxidoreductase [Acidimicrobiales bacterium]|nr:LLM class F420-dependent oxidoreductase [Acidimicrobiales bacterium]